MPDALRIAQAESGGRMDATNYNTDGSVDRCVFQINSIHSARVHGDLNSLYDPETCVRIAHDIWQEQSWQPWVSAKKLGLS